ncbi:MAG: coproporphyrinogen III oxidase family protein [Phycisphaerae bacterium]|nr:coproporphyrinogen III oxidase family protein [Phycisphaerae bacterium]NUQ45681.1 coproporphyrinogen III oxidase family protein [Phycisphaerae bacterium]
MIRLPQAKRVDETQPGNYFVANYPPFSAWRPEHVPAAIAALDASASSATAAPLGLYLHIPFCRKRCKFCYFRVYTDKNADEVQAYIDALTREVSLYAGRAGLRGRQFEFVYFGGGTPSFISAEQLKRLVEGIQRHWTWESAREVTFECEPGTLQKHKLEAIRAIGATRLSLGVEHFDDEILTINGRAHKLAEIFRSYQWARDVGFEQINIDLIAGMLGETDDKWRDAVDRAIALDPDSVTIYQLELPHNTVIVREAQQSGAAPPVADWATKRRWVDEAFARFESAGYVVSSAYTLVRPSRNGHFVYRDSVWRGADMIGTGVASFSHFAGVHYQNVDSWDDYLAALDRGELPIARALPVSADQRLIREMILQMKLGRLERRYFREKFGVEVRDRFRAEFDGLVDEGLASDDADAIRLTRAGLLRADSLLPRFFEPRFRGARYT